MKRLDCTGVAAVALGLILAPAPASSQTRPPTDGPAVDASPAWFLQGSFPDPGGRTIVDADGHVTTVPRDEAGNYSTSLGTTPGCSGSPICGRRGGRTRQSLQRVQWEQTLGYTFTYPYVLPPGFGGVSAVALDAKDNLWIFQRAPAGEPQLFKFDSDYNLVLAVGPDVIGYQDKAHGMAVDAEDNVWITATNGATVMKLSSEGKLLPSATAWGQGPASSSKPATGSWTGATTCMPATRAPAALPGWSRPERSDVEVRAMDNSDAGRGSGR